MKRANPLRPWMFAWVYDTLVATAQDHGYALALHGSMTRDLDLIAVPWTSNASDAKTLIAALNIVADGFRMEKMRNKKHNLSKPEKKPHGRIAWVLHMGGEPYIDISVMPRRVPRKKQTPRRIKGFA